MTFTYTGRTRNKSWRDIQADIEPPDPGEKHCWECYDFIQCPGCDMGICKRQTRWKENDICWMSANDECEVE